MSDIDYIKNVQMSGLLTATDNSIKFTATSMPVTDPPTICIIKQISAMAQYTTPIIYALWSDIVNDHVASWTTGNFVTAGTGELMAVTTMPNTMMKLRQPLAGDIIFKVNEMYPSGKFGPITDPVAVTINLEFIRYKK